MADKFSVAFPRLPERNQPLSEGATKNQRRDRKRPDPKTNLLYTNEAPITTMKELYDLLGLEKIPEIDVSMPFPMQVAASFSQISPLPFAMVMQKKHEQQEILDGIINEGDKLFAQELELQAQLEKIQHKLKELQHQRWIQEDKMSQPPLHIALRHLGDAILFPTSSDVKGTFDKISENIQSILLRVPDLIPDEIKLSEKPVSQVVTMSQAVVSMSQTVVSMPEPQAVAPAPAKRSDLTPTDTFFFSVVSSVTRSPSPGSFGLVEASEPMKAAIQKLKDSGHDIMNNIVIVDGTSDNLTEKFSLAETDPSNARHMHKPDGVIPVKIIWPKDNEKNVREKIRAYLSEGIWPESDKHMLDRLIKIRRKTFSQFTSF